MGFSSAGLSHGQLAAVRAAIGPERLSGYDLAAGDPARAVDLYGWNIARLHHELLEIVAWIDPAVHDWVTAHSRVAALLQAKP